MAHLDQWNPIINLRDAKQEDVLRDDLRRHFWSWYETHKDEIIFRFVIWTWTVEDVLFELFVKLFGKP